MSRYSRFAAMIEQSSDIINGCFEAFFSQLARLVTWLPKVTILVTVLLVACSLIDITSLKLVSDPEVIFVADNSLVSLDQAWEDRVFRNGRKGPPRRNETIDGDNDNEDDDDFVFKQSLAACMAERAQGGGGSRELEEYRRDIDDKQRMRRLKQHKDGASSSSFFIAMKEENENEDGQNLLQNNGDHLIILFDIIEKVEMDPILQEVCNDVESGGCKFLGVHQCWNTTSQQSTLSPRENFLRDTDRSQTLGVCLECDNGKLNGLAMNVHKMDSDDDDDGDDGSLKIDLVRMETLIPRKYGKKMAKYIDSLVLSINDEDTHSDLRISSISYGSLEYEIYDALEHDLPFIVLPIIILAVYTSWIFHRSDRSSHMGMAFLAIFSIILAIAFTTGVTIFAGSPFTALNAVAVFITFGIGIDDAFIIAAATHADDNDFDSAFRSMTPRARIIRGLRCAGPR